MITSKEWRDWYSAEEYNTKNERVKGFPIHFLLALNQKETTICEWMSKKVDRLTAKDPQHFNLTPLMIAAMQGKSAIAAKLLTFENVRASINDADQFGWTALHHAAISSQAIFDQLIASGANKQCLTQLNGSIEDLKALTTLESPNRDLPYFGPRSLKLLWQRDLSVELPEAIYLLADSNAPKCTVTLVKEGFYGLTADQEIARGSVIGYYSGEYTNCSTWKYRFIDNFSPEHQKSIAYILNEWDAREIGNATRHINCGFPNCVPYGIIKNGTEQTIMIATETIKKGEPVLIDYGADAVSTAYGPQILFNKEKMHAFFQPGLVNLTASAAKTQEEFESNSSSTSLFIDFIRISYIHFPLNNPLALLNLHYSGILSAKEWLKPLLFGKNYIVENWVSDHVEEAIYLKRMLIRLIVAEFQIRESNTYPLYQNFMRTHLESFSLMKFVKALDLVEKALLEGKRAFEAGVLAALETYEWTQDETNLYSSKNRRDAQEFELNMMALSRINDNHSQFLQAKKQVIEDLMKDLKTKPEFYGSDQEEWLTQIKEAIPLNEPAEPYARSMIIQLAALRNYLGN